MHFTAVNSQVPEGYVACVEELPGANTQGKTLEEARRNFAKAVDLVLVANCERSSRELGGQVVTREPFPMPA